MNAIYRMGRLLPLIERTAPSDATILITGSARRIGAVNTIARENGELVGHNTDVPGFRVALDALVGSQATVERHVYSPAGSGHAELLLPNGALVHDLPRVDTQDAWDERLPAGALVETVWDSPGQLLSREQPQDGGVADDDVGVARLQA